MIREMWRLSEPGEGNLGLACSSEGLFLGRTPLIERRDARFVVRDSSHIERLFIGGHRNAALAKRVMPGLTTVAAAMNASDPCLARIAAVHLKIPELPDYGARDDMEAEDLLIKSLEWDPAKHPRTGAPPNPGWFALTDGSTDEPASTRTAADDNPTQRSDVSPDANSDRVRLPPGPKRIDELADFVEWLANATPADEQAIRAEIKRYFYNVGDEGSANALNSALTVVLRCKFARNNDPLRGDFRVQFRPPLT